MYGNESGVPNVSTVHFFYTALPTGDILYKTSAKIEDPPPPPVCNLQSCKNEHTSHNKIPVSHPLTNLIPPSGNTWLGGTDSSSGAGKKLAVWAEPNKLPGILFYYTRGHNYKVLIYNTSVKLISSLSFPQLTPFGDFVRIGLQINTHLSASVTGGDDKNKNLPLIQEETWSLTV
jgi:hypothetical protein